MSGPLTRRLIATVPAKLNLGLAIVGRRGDGFHELCSVMQTITLCDRLTLESTPGAGADPMVTLTDVTSGESGVRIDDPGLGPTENLAVRAVAATLDTLRAGGDHRLGLEKGIPAASGMGGASADAAAAILMTERAVGVSLRDEERTRLAATLGSDVPFFLTGGTALVTGRGERVQPLPAIAPTNFVVVYPRLSSPIQRKTHRLFGALRSDDFDDGEHVRRQTDRIVGGQPIDSNQLGNGFGRALLGLAPELAELRRVIADISGQPVALSGAGPTHYVVEPDAERAQSIVGQLRRKVGDGALVVRCEPWSGPPLVELAVLARP